MISYYWLSKSEDIQPKSLFPNIAVETVFSSRTVEKWKSFARTRRVRRCLESSLFKGALGFGSTSNKWTMNLHQNIFEMSLEVAWSIERFECEKRSWNLIVGTVKTSISTDQKRTTKCSTFSILCQLKWKSFERYFLETILKASNLQKK